MTNEQQEKEVKELAEEIDKVQVPCRTCKRPNKDCAKCPSEYIAQHLISKGYRKAGDTISQDSIKAMKKAEAIQFGRIIPIDHDREA